MSQLHRLRDIQILNAVRRETSYWMGDGGNLYLRVLPGEHADKRSGKDWWFRYQADGRRAKLQLGTYLDLTIKEAREKAAEQRKLIEAGIDPKRHRAADDAARKVAAALPQSVNELFAEWRATRLTERKDGGKAVERMFNKDVLGAVGAIPLRDLRRRDIAAILDRVRRRGARRVAGLLLSELRLFVNYAVVRDLIDGDITAGLKAKDWDGQSKQRKRVLSPAEIGELHRKLTTAGMKSSTEAAIWIMLGTMCRIGALSAARWDDIDFKEGTWMAARKSREQEDYTIYLSAFVLRYFEGLKAEQETLLQKKKDQGQEVDLKRYEWVFPAKNPRPASVPPHVYDKTFSKQIYSQQVDTQMKNRPPALGLLKLNGGLWTPHDLRRTGSTLMAAMGIDDKIRELCLNHVPQNRLDGVYNQHKYEKQMRRAWKILGERLEAIQNGARSDREVVRRSRPDDHPAL
ncbi:MAG: tyrosine-type recombinase/integrase [Burkholderiales bacterium]